MHIFMHMHLFMHMHIFKHINIFMHFFKTSRLFIYMHSLIERRMSVKLGFRCNSQILLLCFIGSKNHIKILFAKL